MAETKKILVAFDPAKPNAKSSDFLIPCDRDGKHVLIGLKSGKEYAQGIVVFVGRPISENDLFAKLVDSGASVNNVEKTLLCLQTYLDKLQALKIGNVVQIIAADDGFGLDILARIPSAVKS